MKKHNIIKIIIWLIISVLLLTILLMGINGSFNFFNNSVNFSSSYIYEKSELYSSDEYKQDLTELKSIDTVIIDWISGNVNILTGSEELIFYEESRVTLENDQKLHWLRDGNILYIKFRGSFNKANSFNYMPNKDLYINIPESATDIINILDINTISAPVHIDGGVYKKLNIETISGDASILCSFDLLYYNSISGDLEAYSNDCPAEVNAETIIGKLNLILNENRSFSVKINTIIGDFLCDIDEVSPKKRIYNHVNNTFYDQSFNAIFNFETICGNVSISKGPNYQ